MLIGLLAEFVPDPFGGGRSLTVNDVLEQYIWVFYTAFIVAFVFTPIMRVVANYYGIIDQPDRVRKMHNVPVAYLGGMAVFLGWLSGLAMSQFRAMPFVEPGMPQHATIPFSIIAGACVIIVLGLWDDVLGIRPWVKIAGQASAAMFLIAEDIGTHCTALLFGTVNRWLHVQQLPGHWMNGFAGPGVLQIPEMATYVTSSVVVVCVVIACCNATNLMDGLDGLCGGVTAVIAGGFLFLAVHLAMSSGGFNPNLDSVRVVVAIALLGAVLGFIPYNFNPASIFMGDTGSMFLGYCCASMIILMSQGQHWKWFLASMVMFALPVLDTALAFARRWVNGRPLFSPDKLHFHHQLVARGFSVKKAVMVSYGLALFFAVCGALIVFIRTRYAVAFYLIIFGYIIVAAYKMGMVHEKPRVVTRSDLTEGLEIPPSLDIEPGTVIEIRDAGDRPALTGPVGAAASDKNALAPQAL
jgi:UDP-GlcNAc:undecaprenyl-phosphate GlcNAc-1-phosphate transferase